MLLVIENTKCNNLKGRTALYQGEYDIRQTPPEVASTSNPLSSNVKKYLS